MNRQYYLDLARSGLRMPIGTDLVLREQADPDGILQDGVALGRVVELAARRYRTPLAFPLMDLTLEREDLLRLLEIPEAAEGSFQFATPPGEREIAKARERARVPFSRRHEAHIDAVAYVARDTELIAIGMSIGPFSLMTRLMADPITAVALAGMGVTGADEPAVAIAERCLALAEMAVQRSVSAQARAGARAVIVCEPAANRVYLSPKQIQAGSDIFERFVIEPQLRLKRLLDEAAVDLIFHDCGELTGSMVERIAAALRPVILSLGSSRKLWEDAAVVPKNVVLYGNLPTKNFYSDAVVPMERVRELTVELIARMQAAGHPHIVGSECDVLHVTEAAEAIRAKVDVMLTASA